MIILTWQSAQPDQKSQDCNKTPLTKFKQWSAEKPIGLPFSSPLDLQLTLLLLTGLSDRLSAHLLACSLHSYCWQASWISFQLTSWLPAYWRQYRMAGGILKNCWQAPEITFQLTSALAAYIQSVAAHIQAATFGTAGLDSMPREQAQEGQAPG